MQVGAVDVTSRLETAVGPRAVVKAAGEEFAGSVVDERHVGHR